VQQAGHREPAQGVGGQVEVLADLDGELGDPP